MPLSLKIVASDPIVPKKPPVEATALAHKELRQGTWWQRIPAYKAIDEATFLDHAWQAKSSITRVAKLVETIQELVPSGFVDDLENGMKRAPMSVRVSPYLVSLIDWEHPYEDPLRTQFFPLASRLLPDHPNLGLDSRLLDSIEARALLRRHDAMKNSRLIPGGFFFVRSAMYSRW